MINRVKLRREMYAKNINVIELARRLRITNQCMYNKLNSTSEFKESEIDSLIRIFGKDIVK